MKNTLDERTLKLTEISPQEDSVEIKEYINQFLDDSKIFLSLENILKKVPIILKEIFNEQKNISYNPVKGSDGPLKYIDTKNNFTLTFNDNKMTV